MPKRKVQNKVQHSRAALQAQIHAAGKLNNTLRKRAHRYLAMAREFDQLHRDRQDLLAKVNEALAEIAADGRYDQFVDRWMVQGADAAPAAE